MHRDRGFWADIFNKSPLIATCMAGCGVGGLGLGVYCFSELLGPHGSLRFFLLLLVVTTLAGIGVGLVVGVLADSLWKAFRGDDEGNKKRKPRDRW